MTTKRLAILLALVVPTFAGANERLQTLTADSNNWAIWGGNYAGTRYSELNQIDKSNVGRLQVAWTFSTGVLRGHEGGPLVVGDTLIPGATDEETLKKAVAAARAKKKP